jgi:SAM-dependent methyltransferase
MKARESGMPDEDYWASFFDAGRAVDLLWGEGADHAEVVEFGCGYGTFTLPAARRAGGLVTALDIEPEMVARVQDKARAAGLANIHAVLRDFVAEGTGLDAATQTHAMIFNLLHLEQPVALLREAHRILLPGGTVSVIHWRSDITTPRGPPPAIRPSPDQCRRWLAEAGFGAVRAVDLADCCPFHFGLVASR